MQKLSKQSSDLRSFSKTNQASWLYCLFLLRKIEEYHGFATSVTTGEIGAEMLHIYLQKKAEKFVAMCSEWAEVFRLPFWTWAFLIQVWDFQSLISFFCTYQHLILCISTGSSQCHTIWASWQRTAKWDKHNITGESWSQQNFSEQ